MNFQLFIIACNKDSKFTSTKLKVDEALVKGVFGYKKKLGSNDVTKLWGEVMKDPNLKQQARLNYSRITLDATFEVWKQSSPKQKVLVEHFIYVCLNDSFQRKIELLRKYFYKFNIQFPFTIEEKRKLLNEKFEKDDGRWLSTEVSILCCEFGLQSQYFYHQPITDYDTHGADTFSVYGGNSILENIIFHNDPFFYPCTSCDDVVRKWKIKPGYSYLSIFPYLEVFLRADVSRKEFLRFIDELREVISKQKKRYRISTKKELPKRDLLRDYQIWQLHRKPQSYRNIKEELKGSYPLLTCDVVRQSVKRMKREIEKAGGRGTEK